MKKTVSMLLAVIFLFAAFCCAAAEETAWICENCGAEMTTKFCTVCGAKKPEPTPEPEATPEPAATENTAWICSSCGAEMNTRFCTVCGAKKPEPAAPEVTPEPAAANDTTWHCDNCDADMDTKFCTICGAKRPDSAGTPEPEATPEPTAELTPEPTPEPEPESTGWICPVCGAEYPEDYLFCPKDGSRKGEAEQPEPDGPEPGTSAHAWPEMPMDGISVKLSSLDKDNRHQSYFGPDRKKYPGAGAFVPRNTRAATALFIDSGYILVDLDYPAVGRRCVYFMPYSIKNTSGREIPEVTLTAHSAEVTESVQPAYGPGENYDVLKKSEKAKNGQMMQKPTILEAGTEIDVFFEMNGWVYAEFQCNLGLVRAWVPADAVR